MHLVARKSIRQTGSQRGTKGEGGLILRRRAATSSRSRLHRFTQTRLTEYNQLRFGWCAQKSA